MSLRGYSPIQRFWFLDRFFIGHFRRQIRDGGFLRRVRNKIEVMIIITVHKEGREKNPFGDRFKGQIMDMERRVYETLFEGLECDNEDHKDFDNIIQADFKEQPAFKIEKICCRDFEMKIRKAVM
jgi:hypothetical protein